MKRFTLLLGMSALAYTAAAAAQDMPASGTSTSQQATATSTDASTDTTAPKDIVVTGIRESLERAAQIKRDAP